MRSSGRYFGLRLPRRRQQDRTDCGAACLAAVADFYGLRLPLARIRQQAGTDVRGTTVLGLVEAATALGLAAKGVRAAPDALSAIPFPAIAHVVVDGFATHFVVVYRADATRVILMDPREGRVRKVDRQAFEADWTGVLLILAPTERFQPGDARRSLVGRFLSLVRPHRVVMAQALVGAAVYTLLGLSTAVFVQKLVDHVLPDGNRNLLNLLGIAMVALLGAQLAIGALKDLFALRTGQKIDASLILGYYKHVLGLPQRFFDSMRVGEVLSRVNDAVKIRAFLNDVALDLTVNALVLAFSIALMFAYSWRLALLMAASLPLHAAVYWGLNRSNRTVQRRLMETAADLESQLVESVTAATTVKRFRLEEYAADRTERRFVRVLRNVYASGVSYLAARGASDLLSRLSVVVLLWVGAAMVIERSITAGELMSMYALAGYMAGPVVALVSSNRTLQEALIAADRLFEILDLATDGGTGALPLPADATPDVVFEHVSFGYGGRELVLDGLDLRIGAGAMTAIVGESGSGKSTLAALIQAIYAPTEGRIRIGGHDLRQLEPASVREFVRSVPQQIHLFNGTVLDNVAIGDPRPDVRRVLQVCEELGIADFVERLPAGYRTELGENGATLSGGQRQRLAIARAIYRRPRILVLDEATSSLDAASEECVQRTLRRLREEGCTIVVIAHRFSTLRAADRIVVLDRGKTAEAGTHDELVRSGGTYDRLWRRQWLGAAPDGAAAG